MRDQTITGYMGKLVQVIVDRPAGYRHGDIVYPINYGYIPGTIAADGEPQDAYILGVEEPMHEFCGRVIGFIRRLNDCEDKLVVAPDGIVYHQGEIAQAVRFQEQYFQTSVQSIFQKSCGVIPYRTLGTGREYLIVLQKNNCWSFPKGRMEADETEVQTALRELFEETGLVAQLDLFRKVILKYDINSLVRKHVVLFCGQISGDVVIQKSEISEYRWVNAEDLKGYLHRDTFDACRSVLL